MCTQTLRNNFPEAFFDIYIQFVVLDIGEGCGGAESLQRVAGEQGLCRVPRLQVHPRILLDCTSRSLVLVLTSFWAYNFIKLLFCFIIPAEVLKVWIS